MRGLILGLLALVGTQVQAADAPAPKVVVIDGAISSQSMGPINQYVNSLLEQKQAPDELQMVLSSPGGSVTTGFIFLDRIAALKQRGTKIKCHVAEVAASMAFQILLQCDERTALDTSFLLWHRARVFLGGMMGTAMTGPELYSLGVQLKDLDNHIYRDVRSKMPDAPEHYTRFHFEKETLHTGANLAAAVPGFLELDTNPSWTMGQLTNPDAVHTARASLFDSIRFGDLLYIWDRAIPLQISGGK